MKWVKVPLTVAMQPTLPAALHPRDQETKVRGIINQVQDAVADCTLQVAEEVTQWVDGPSNIHAVRVGMLVAQPHMRDEMDSLALPWLLEKQTSLPAAMHTRLQMRNAALAACRCASDTAIRDLARTLLVGIAASSPSEIVF